MYANFVIIAYALLAAVLIAIVLGKKGREEDNNLRRMKTIGKEVVKTDYKNVDSSFYDRLLKPVVNKMSTPTEAKDKNGKKTEKQKIKIAQTERMLRQAGLHVTASNYQFFKMAFLVVASIVFVGLGLILMNATEYFYIVMAVGVIAGAVGPDFILKSKVTKHQKAIKSQLPDALDLLSVCMEAGMSFDASLLKVSERMEGPFIDELMTVFRQIQMGKSRNDALKTLSDSTDIPELKTFLSSLMQANTLGIPITNVMKVQSEQLRNARKQELKEKAAQVPVKMTIPTVMLIIPTVFVIILAPVLFSVMDSGVM